MKGPLLALLTILTLLPACKVGTTAITGRIVATRDGQLVPVGDAQVRLWPSEPGKKAEKFEAEAVQNLRGISTTRPNGNFEVTTLSSPQTNAEYPLLRGWGYTLEVEVPGFYVTQAKFELTSSSQYLEVQIEEKMADVLDTTGVIQENEKELQRGAVRKE